MDGSVAGSGLEREEQLQGTMNAASPGEASEFTIAGKATTNGRGRGLGSRDECAIWRVAVPVEPLHGVSASTRIWLSQELDARLTEVPKTRGGKLRSRPCAGQQAKVRRFVHRSHARPGRCGTLIGQRMLSPMSRRLSLRLNLGVSPSECLGG